MIDSRISNFYRLSRRERVVILRERGILDDEMARRLDSHRGLLPPDIADRMIENVIGVFGLPLAVAPNFIINGREYVVPMVVEEPSIVAGVSAAARLARDCGGFTASSTRPVLIGQIHLCDVADAEASIERLKGAEQNLVDAANRLHPRLPERGGGAIGMEFRKLLLPGGRTAIVAHLLVDTRDAMGANIVNSMCECIADEVGDLADAKPSLRILSNLADRSMLKASVTIPCNLLGDAGEKIRDNIVLANDIALVDPYRAATHNKGIMNGMDAVAVATGNDWRALEAGAHAFAARDGTYKALTSWSVTKSGDLGGLLEVPVRMGIVGGSLRSNPAAIVGLSIVGVKSSQELCEVMAAVGLAQNFAALKALTTDGIQKGHMRLHARSVAAAAGVPRRLHDEVVSEMLATGEIREWRAKELLTSLDARQAVDGEKPRGTGVAGGKIILLGEHAVVYGRPALALPIAGAIRASIRDGGNGIRLSIPAWSVDQAITSGMTVAEGAMALLQFVVRELGIDSHGLLVEVDARIPAAAGLGASAALAVALIRAFNEAFERGLSDAAINSLAFDCERLAHGTPSGIDNTLAVYGRPILFSGGGKRDSEIREIELRDPPPIVIAFSGSHGSTRAQVDGVRKRRDKHTLYYERIFDEIGRLSLDGYDALEEADYPRLGTAMNICHGLLNALQVSTPLIEDMVNIARTSGALGAKLTGGGGGGSVVALCPGRTSEVAQAFQLAGFEVVGAGIQQGLC